MQDVMNVSLVFSVEHLAGQVIAWTSVDRHSKATRLSNILCLIGNLE